MNKTLIKNRHILWLIIFIPILALACRISVPVNLEDNQTINPQPNFTEIIENPISTITAQSEIPTDQPEVTTLSNSEESIPLAELYAIVNPAVVNIATYVITQGNAIPSSQGSGFVYDSDGHIITNAHVIHGVDQIDVVFSDSSTSSAEVIGEDLHSDLAVIKIEVLPPGISPLPLGDIESVAVGQTVYAIGNPFGLGGTLTEGIVSALGRTIPALTSFSIPSSIQTDAAINPGNSGGPLLNTAGEVIGVNAQIQTDGFTNSNRGVGFAIPVNIVARVVPELIQNQEFNWPWLGVRGNDMNPTIATALGIETARGAYIAEVLEDGPAIKAGLRGSTGTEKVRSRLTPVGGDVIIAINDQPVRSFDDLLIFIALNSSPGDQVTLTIIRDGETIEIPLKLEERPAMFETVLP